MPDLARKQEDTSSEPLASASMLMSIVKDTITTIKNQDKKILMLQVAQECLSIIKAYDLRVLGLQKLIGLALTLVIGGFVLAIVAGIWAPSLVWPATTALGAGGVMGAGLLALAANSKVEVSDLRDLFRLAQGVSPEKE